MCRRLHRRAFVGAIVALWLVAASAGFARLMQYATTPGSDQPAPSDWPAEASLRPDPGHDNLVLFAHPHCTCTRATLAQLEELAARCPELAIHVLFVRPRDGAEDWTQTDLWRQAVAIRGATVTDDAGGVEARRFGAATSGLALLYRRDGRLVFHGGITDARGQAGGSAGLQAIVALLTGGAGKRKETPAFGCPLFDPTPSADQGALPCCKD